MRYCQKCNSKLPYTVIINGKRKNIGNRKFCLECSPFGKHNTRANLDKPAHRPIKNGKRPYKDWSEDAKNDNRARIYWRGKKRKQKLIEMHGSKCPKCNYCKCERSLTFHHIDPKTKTFNITVREMQMRTWQEILDEVKKCEMLCFNCHMEIEEKFLEKKYASFKHNYPDPF